MFKTLLILGLAVVPTVRAAPTSRGLITDQDILQYALTLEHLENAFYRTGLNSFDDNAFKVAGYPPDVRLRFAQIGQHEDEHVNFLSDTLGSNATKPCVYDFPTPDVRSFVALSGILENVGDSAYIGAAYLIQDPNYLTSAATILSVEARHAAWVASTAEHQDPFPQAFDTPLVESEVLVLAFQFIKSCPLGNPILPFEPTPFPTLSLSDDSPAPGAGIIAQFNSMDGAVANDHHPAYIAWLDGSKVEYSELRLNGETTVPHGLNGTVYALAVSSKSGGMPRTSDLLSGLAVAHVSHSSRA